ncbi:MAG TPA: zf-HC2 domain-containing protein [Actinomycetes bacterium]|nr:zf-HC2 domain-containing protein [Actinomycetes bacterium]
MSVRELTCKEVVELLGDYLEGALPGEERERVESHLAGCEACSTYLEQLRTTIRLTGRLPEEPSAEACEPLLEAFRVWRAR